MEATYFSLTNPQGYFNASYGVVPKPVHAYHQMLLNQCESNPYRWFTRDCKDLIHATKHKLSTDYLHCDPNDVVLVDNSSSGANSVFESIITTSDRKSAIVLLRTAYGLIVNLANKYAESQKNCELVYVDVCLDRVDSVVENVAMTLDRLLDDGFEIRLTCIDHIASSPGILIPVREIAQQCKKRGVDLFVDGAHALGQVQLDLIAFEEAGVTYWVTDAHKWFFSPKGSAVLWVCKDKQHSVFPCIDGAHIGSPGCTVLENDVTSNREYQSVFSKRFEYLGTKDYTPWIAIFAAMDFVESGVIGGYKQLIEHNRDTALFAQRYMSDRLESDIVLDDSVTVSMCNVQLPFITTSDQTRDLMMYLEGLGIYTVIFEYPSDTFWIRVCAQCFVNEEHIKYLTKELLYYKNNMGFKSKPKYK